MRAIKKVKWLFWLSVAFISIMSTTILFMPYAVNSMNKNYVIAVGATFWGALVVGYTLVVIANITRKYFIVNLGDKKLSMNCRVGIVTFFSNKLAVIIDVTMMFSFVLSILLFFSKLRDSYYTYLFLFLLILSINLHCLFNGRIYKFIKIRGTRGETSYE